MGIIVKVKDIPGTSRLKAPKCPCKSWIEHWDVNSRLARPSVCPVCGQYPTKMNPLVGGHVKITAYFDIAQLCWRQCNDEKYYITPICSSCNARGGFTDIEVDDDYLVSARKEDCCRYRG